MRKHQHPHPTLTSRSWVIVFLTHIGRASISRRRTWRHSFAFRRPTWFNIGKPLKNMFGCRKSSDIFTGLRRDFAVHAEVFARALVSRARAYIDEKGGCEIGCEKSSDQRTPLWGRCWAAAIWRSNPFRGSHASSCVGCQALSDVPYPIRVAFKRVLYSCLLLSRCPTLRNPSV